MRLAMLTLLRVVRRKGCLKAHSPNTSGERGSLCKGRVVWRGLAPVSTVKFEMKH